MVRVTFGLCLVSYLMIFADSAQLFFRTILKKDVSASGDDLNQKFIQFGGKNENGSMESALLASMFHDLSQKVNIGDEIPKLGNFELKRQYLIFLAVILVLPLCFLNQKYLAWTSYISRVFVYVYWSKKLCGFSSFSKKVSDVQHVRPLMSINVVGEKKLYDYFPGISINIFICIVVAYNFFDQYKSQDGYQDGYWSKKLCPPPKKSQQSRSLSNQHLHPPF